MSMPSRFMRWASLRLCDCCVDPINPTTAVSALIATHTTPAPRVICKLRARTAKNDSKLGERSRHLRTVCRALA